MRALPLLVFLMMTTAGTAAAAKAPQTEAEQDGLNGPVHSVVMTNQKVQFNLEPATAWALQYIQSGIVEYDITGRRTKIGSFDQRGVFSGQKYQYRYDGNGHVLGGTMKQLPSREVLDQNTYGPFGLVECRTFSSGKLQTVHTIRYDRQGKVLEDLIVSGDGKPIQRIAYRRNSKGDWVVRTMWVEGFIHSYETYDPDTDFQRYEQYDKSGGLIRTFTFSHDRVETYWSASTDPKGGTPLVDKLSNGDTESWMCHDGDRTCVGHVRHAVYLEAARHNPVMTEILSDSGEPLVRTFYEYQMDGHDNWTGRTVWVQLGEQGERRLYETDSRTITYWPK